MNGMSRVFVGLGLVVMVGFLVVEFLPSLLVSRIASEVANLNSNELNTGLHEPSSKSQISIKYLLTSIKNPEPLCGLPSGRNVISMAPAVLKIRDKDEKYEAHITGGRTGKNFNLPYHDADGSTDYYYGILFGETPTPLRQSVNVPSDGCVPVKFNVPQAMLDAFNPTLEKPTTLNISVGPD
jgi:hypothetical protein